MGRVSFGDIIEIKLNHGLIYAQYTHKHPQYGALIRVFNTVYATQPSDWKYVRTDKVRFSCFFPLSAAINKNIFKIVGHSEVAEENKQFPIFRSGIIDPITKKVATWWLWDGNKSWMIGDLNAEQRKMPIRGVWNDTMLIKRLEENWTPEKDVTT